MAHPDAQLFVAGRSSVNKSAPTSSPRKPLWDKILEYFTLSTGQEVRGQRMERRRSKRFLSVTFVDENEVEKVKVGVEGGKGKENRFFVFVFVFPYWRFRFSCAFFIYVELCSREVVVKSCFKCIRFIFTRYDCRQWCWRDNFSCCRAR